MSCPPVRVVGHRSWSCVRASGSRYVSAACGEATACGSAVVARPRPDRPAPRPYARPAAAGPAGDLASPSSTSASAPSASMPPATCGAAGRRACRGHSTCGSAKTSATVLIGPGRHADLLQRGQQVVARRSRTCARRAAPTSRVAVARCAAHCWRSPDRSASAGTPSTRAELAVLAVIAGGDDDVAVRDREDLVGHDVGMRVAHARRATCRRRGSSAPGWRARRPACRAAPCRYAALAGRVALAQRRQDGDRRA